MVIHFFIEGKDSNGIGCFSQESTDLQGPDAQLLCGLARAGFVTMRVEKSGMGDSQDSPCAREVLLSDRVAYMSVGQCVPPGLGLETAADINFNQ